MTSKYMESHDGKRDEIKTSHISLRMTAELGIDLL